MSDIYDRLLDQAPSQKPLSEGPDRYDQILNQRQDDQMQALMTSLKAASQSDPNKAGEAQRMATQLGLPSDVAERSMDEVRDLIRQKAIENQRLMTQSPILARQLQDLEFAKIAQDQIENLSSTERAFKWFREIPEDISKGWEAGRLQSEQGILGEKAQRGAATPEDWKRIGGIDARLRELKGTGGFAEATTKILGQMSYTMPESVAYGEAAALTAGSAALIAGQVGPQVALPEEIFTVPGAAIGGFFAGMTAKMAEQSYRIEVGQSYLDMIKEGIDKDVARNVSAGVGLVNATLEVVGVGFVTAPIKQALIKEVTQEISKSLTKPTTAMAVKEFAKNYGKAWTGEVTTELLQEVSAIAGDEIARAYSKPELESKLSTAEGRKEIAERLSSVFEEVGKGMAVLALPGAGLNFRSDYKRAQEAKRQTQFFTDLTNSAVESETRKRNPDAYQNYIAQQAQDTGAENIYVDAQQFVNVLRQSGITEEQLAQTLPEVAPTVSEALQTGGDVMIPTAQYAAKIAGTDFGNALMQHARIDPDAMSAAEAVEFEQNKKRIMEEAGKVLEAKQATDDAFVQSAREVERRMFDQLKSTKQYPDSVARTNAQFVRDFVVTQAAALKMMPGEFYDKYMYRVEMAEQQAAQGEILSQEAKPSFYRSLPELGFTRIDNRESPRIYTSKGGEKFLTFERDGLRAAFSSNNILYEDEKGRVQVGYGESNESVLRALIVDPEARQQGKATAALQEIIDLADRSGTVLYLEPAPIENGKMSAAQLADFYKRFGFVQEKEGSNKVLVRQPAQQEGDMLRQAAFGGPEVGNTPIGDVQTVTVNGKERTVFNSEGRPIHTTLEGIRNFWRWFGDSKVVDTAGKPLVVYHGSGAKGIRVFDISKYESVQRGDWGKGIYFTPSQWHATGYKTTAVQSQDPAIKAAYDLEEQTAKEFGTTGMMKWIDLKNNKITQEQYDKLVELENQWRAALKQAEESDRGEVYPAYIRMENPYVYIYGGITEPDLAERAKAAGHDGIIVKNEEGVIEEVIAFEPTQIKSVNNQGTFSPTDADILRQAAQVATGPQLFQPVIDALNLTPQEVASTAMQWMTGLPGVTAFMPPRVGGIPDVVKFLNEQRLASGLPVLDITKPEDRTQLARLMAAEAMAAIRSEGTALEWYDQTIRNMLAQMAIKYPELNTDENARNAFLMSLAISSQGLNVEDNLKFASEQYEQFRTTGKFPETGKGETAQAMAGNFRLANNLLEEMGPDLLRRFLTTEFTVKELQTAGFDVGGELMDEKVLGSAVFGPKIGFGFYSNLTGNFNPVTMDMWFMRTVGRLAGTLPAFDPEKFAGQLDRFRTGLKERGKKDTGIFASQFDKDLVSRAKTDDAAAIELARLVKSAHEKDFKNNRADYDSGKRQKSTMVAAAETMIQSLDKPKDVPASGGERRLLRDVVRQATDLVSQQYGQRVPPAAFQALIWYPEQELYSALGVKLRVTSQDYSGAARKVLEKEGINGEQLDAAVTGAQLGSAIARGVAGEAVAGIPAQAGQGPSQAGPFTVDERTQFIIERNRKLLEQQALAKINFEVAPDPNNAELVARWRALTSQQRLDISLRVAQQIVPKVLRQLKFKGEIQPQTGSYLDDTNPSFAIRLDKGNVETLTKVLGYVLSQDSMMAIASAEFPGSYKSNALRIEIGDKTTAEIEQIYNALRAIEVDGKKPIGGQSTSGGFMTILLDKKADVEVMSTLVNNALNDAYVIKVHEVFAAFPEKQEYDYADSKSDPAGNEGMVRQRARDARAEATKLLGRELDAAGILRQSGIGGVQRLRAGDLNVAQRYGQARNGSTSVVGIHYSGQTRASLASTFYGTGLRGAESRRLVGAEPRLSNRIHFYVDTGAGVLPEAGVGNAVHAVNLDNLYDAAADPLGLRAKAEANGRDLQGYWFNDVESAILNAGFDGVYLPYAQGDQGVAVLLGPQHSAVPVDQVQPSAAQTLAQRSAEASRAAAGFAQQARGGFDPRRLTTILNEKADLSTFLHETAHFFLTVYADMANQPNATEQMKADMQTVLDWFGVKDLATWNAMSLEEQRKYHEQFAYNYELYLFEGKAPSVELQSLFDRFSAWLRRVYQSIRDDLNAIYRQEHGEDLPILTGEVRQVMDRMLASQEQIQQAEQVRNMVPMFQSQEQSGMGDPEWAAYQAMLQEARDAAITDLTKASMRQMKWLQNARSRILKDLQKQADTQRKEVRAEVTAEVEAEPVYRAMRFLKRGETVNQDESVSIAESNYKFSMAALEEMYAGEGDKYAFLDWSKLGTGQYGMVAKEGLHPDLVAGMFGFDSGDALVRALLAAPPMKEAIDAKTDQQMLERYGEMSDPKAIELAVEQALHNEARARFVAVELRFMAKATQPVRVMLQAAKMAARAIISGRRLSDIKPREYSIAEGRAARQALDLMKKGKSAEAAQAKQNQLVQNQLAAEAVAAKREIEKALESFKKFFRSDEKIARGRNMDLVDAARSILAYYGLGKKGKSPAEYIEKVKAYNPDLYAEIEPIIIKTATGAANYTELTMDEFRAMRDTVEALWFQSKRENEVMIEGKILALDQVTGELNARLEEIGIPDVVPGEEMAPGQKDRVVRSFYSAKAITRRVEHWADATDGAKGPGPFTKYIWRPIRAALDAYRIDRNKYVKQYVELIKKLDLPVAKIEAPELRYTFGNENGGIGKAELLGALLHTGNESNLKKLLLGRGWGDLRPDGTVDTGRWKAFEARMIAEGKLTKADYDFAQAVWDLNEELKPMAQKAHHDLFGYYFKEVEASPVVTPFGVYRGGYVPAKTDPFIVRDAQRQAKMEELESDFRQSMPSTGMGFTKSRVEYNKALSLDIRLMAKHIDDVIRFSHVQPVVKDTLRILRRREFADNLTRLDPTAIEDMLIPWLNRAARQITAEPGMHKSVDNFWRAVRSRTGIAIMFANITNALQQMTGYFPAALKVKPKYLKSALATYLGGPQKVTEEVAGLSKFMADRLNNQVFDMQDTMNELLLNPTKFDKIQTWSAHHGYFLQQAFQNQVDVVTWTGAFNQTLAELGADKTDAQAVREATQRADAAVRMTQSSLLPEDVAAFEVGSPFYKTLVQFSGYFNMIANLNANEYVKVFRDLGWRGNKGKLFMIYLLGFGLPMLISDAIVRTLGGQWDDDDDDGYLDEVMEWFFGSQIRGAVALIPAFGPGIAAIGNAFNNKPYDDRMTTSPSVSALEGATVGVVKAGINIVSEDKEVTGKNIRDILTMLSLITGIPLTVLGRPIGYAVDVERGKIQPTSEADYLRGLVTGKASEESRP